MSKITHVVESSITYPKRYGYSYSKQNLKSDLKINGLDTETDKGKPFLLGFYLHNGKKGYNIVRSLSDILEILTSKKYQNGINLFYNLTYDAEGILKYFPKSEIIKIYFKHNVELIKQKDGSYEFIDLTKYEGKRGDFEDNRNCYRITYIPSKFLRIKHGHETYNYYDLLQYYNTSLDKAGSKYLKLKKLKVNRELISKERFFKDKEFRDLMIKYVIRDSEICQKLGDLLFQNIYTVYNSKKFISSASIAEDYITHHVNIHLPKLNREIINAFLSSYHGGRFEILKRGSIPNAKEYDISSAYGKEMAEMPMLTKNCMVIKVYRENYDCLYGTYNIDVKIPNNLYVSPLPFFDKKDNLLKFPTGTFKNYWVDKVELDYLRQQRFKYKLNYGYEIHDDNAEKLLKPIMENAYRKKQYYKSIGDDIKANSYKTITNACYDNKTELLTIGGWKKWNEIKKDELIYTFNKKTGFVFKEKIKKLFIYKYNGIMMGIKTPSIDFLVTPNHRILYTLHRGINEKFQIKEMKYLPKTTMFFRTSGNYRQQNIAISDDFIKLIAWIITEGNYQKTKNNDLTMINIRQSKKVNPEYFNEIKTCLDNLSYEYSISFDGYERFYIKSKYSKIIKIFLPNKIDIPKWVFQLSLKQRKLFIETLLKGDGNIKTRFFCQKSKLFVDKLQHLCSISNYSSILSLDKDGNIYHMYIRDKKYKYINYKKFFKQKYKGIVWCVETNNGFIITRRNGKVCINGNSYGKFIQTIREKVFEEINDVELINKLSKNEIFFLNDKIYMGIGGDSYRVGNLFAPFYASYITAKIRVKLLNTLSGLKDTSIHAFHTDSIITDSDIKTGNEMGSWELKQVGNLKLCKSGYYKLGNKTRCRGYSHFNPQKSMQKRRIGLGYAIHNSKIDDLNVIFEKEIAFNLSDNKRLWIKVNQHLENSKPLRMRNI